MLEIKNLNQTYFYGTNALKGISFVLNEGEKIAVLSKNGGGKTSLLKCIAGLFPADYGNIILNGKDITNLKPKDRDVRLVYDDGGLISKRTVKFNLLYPLKIRKIEKNERINKVYSVAKEYGLDPFLNEYAYRLFTPEIIALSLARVALRDSGLTLIDDVFSLANGIERKNLFEKFLPKLRNIPGNVIFATDSVEEAFAFGDRVLILNSGYQDQIGTVEEIRNNPNTLFVDQYVNPEKNRELFSVSNGIISLKNCSLKLCEPYSHNEVFVSYSLIPCENGYSFDATHKFYLGNGQYIYASSDGEKIATFGSDINLKVAVDTTSIKIYDRISEKLLTHEII